jgi:hypothetical protein
MHPAELVASIYRDTMRLQGHFLGSKETDAKLNSTTFTQLTTNGGWLYFQNSYLYNWGPVALKFQPIRVGWAQGASGEIQNCPGSGRRNWQ